MGAFLALSALASCGGGPVAQHDRTPATNEASPENGPGSNGVSSHDEGDSMSAAGVDRVDTFPNLGQQGLEKASHSFSSIEFGVTAAQASPKLEKLTDGRCERYNDCSFLDGGGVGHYFWDDELVLKMVDPKRFVGRAIPAFEIGLARSKPEVLAAISVFFGGASPLCYPHEEYGSESACQLMLGEGWTTLFFDRDDRLVYIRLDAYHFV